MYSSRDLVFPYEIGYLQSTDSNNLSNTTVDNDSLSSIIGSTTPILTTGDGWGVYVIRLRIPGSKIKENIEKGLSYITFRFFDTSGGATEFILLDAYPTMN